MYSIQRQIPEVETNVDSVKFFIKYSLNIDSYLSVVYTLYMVLLLLY